MIRVVIFGNSGSGKSTLAQRYAKMPGLSYLDLDTIAWKPEQPGIREDLDISIQTLNTFTSANEEWVIEGCYSSLIGVAVELANEMIFLNPGSKDCQRNCRNRPWEPHKYATKIDQDRNLGMLLKWVSDYESREDEFSLLAHRKVFDSFTGKKQELKTNEEAQRKADSLST